jgi:hypothetical protein
VTKPAQTGLGRGIHQLLPVRAVDSNGGPEMVRVPASVATMAAVLLREYAPNSGPAEPVVLAVAQVLADTIEDEDQGAAAVAVA